MVGAKAHKISLCEHSYQQYLSEHESWWTGELRNTVITHVSGLCNIIFYVLGVFFFLFTFLYLYNSFILFLWDVESQVI